MCFLFCQSSNFSAPETIGTGHRAPPMSGKSNVLDPSPIEAVHKYCGCIEPSSFITDQSCRSLSLRQYCQHVIRSSLSPADCFSTCVREPRTNRMPRPRILTPLPFPRPLGFEPGPSSVCPEILPFLPCQVVTSSIPSAVFSKPLGCGSTPPA